VIELTNPLTFLLLLNSFITILLIFNQNDSAKDSTSSQNSTSSTNPLEIFTWICLIIQLILLLIKTKQTDF
jgi:heme/copper-type cytochrome/quinol oxidase subunit 2